MFSYEHHWGCIMTNNIDIDQQLLEFIALSHTKLTRPINERFKPALSPLQTNVILLLKIYGPMTMSQLTDKLLMPKQQMTQIAHHLESIGYISRRVDRDDRRRIIVELTEQAETFVQTNVSAFLERVLNGKEKFTNREKKQLALSLLTLNTLLQKISVE